MKAFKIYLLLAVIGILLAPATAHARSPRFSFSLNIVDAFLPCFAPPPPMPVPVYCVPCPPLLPPQQIIINQYHYGCHCAGCTVQEIKPRCPCGHSHR